jgi:arylsulfatase A-like enzyme
VSGYYPGQTQNRRKHLMDTRQKYNILFVLTDQLNFKHLSCYGNDIVRTPNIQRLAERGLVFDNMYCTSPVCVPARTTLTTGLTPAEVGAAANYFPQRQDCRTMPEYLKKSGYKTCVMGKLHWLPYEWEYSHYDEAIDEAHLIAACLRDKAPYSKFIRDHYAERGLDHKAQLPDFTQLLDPAHEYDYDVLAGVSPLPYDISPSKYLADRADDFFQRVKDDDEAFLLYWSALEPHHPYFPSREFSGLYLDQIDEIRDRFILDTERKEPFCQDADFIASKLDKKRFDKVIDAYLGLITEFDHSLGLLLDSLEDNGLAKNTVIIFTADHGDMMGDFGLLFKNKMYESSVKVPFIISHPEHAGGKRTASLTSHLDFLPTILDIAGISASSLPGKSLMPLLIEPAQKLHKAVFSEMYLFEPSEVKKIDRSEKSRRGELSFERAKTDMYVRLMMRDEQFKCIRRGQGLEISETELYDLTTDPNELHDLSDNPQFASLLGGMTQQLDGFQNKQYNVLKAEY